MAMAVGDIFGNLKDKVVSAYMDFFYNRQNGAPNPSMQEENYRQQERRGQWNNNPYNGQNGQNSPQQQNYTTGYQQPRYGQVQYSPQNYGQNAYQQPYAQSGYQQQPYSQNSYQQQTYAQNGYQQQQQQSYGQSGYQQPGAAHNTYSQPVQQAQPEPRGRMRRAQQKGKVVDFGAYQQQNGASQAEQPVQEQPVQQNAGQLSARIINARGMGECRMAITLLRDGEAVVIVMENIRDSSEMRRLVDMLSGACYSLTATITKVSQHGVYLLAPQTLTVLADQATNQMNGASVRMPQRPVYQPGSYAASQPQRPPYTGAASQWDQQPRQQQPAPQQTNPYADAQGFSQRMADPAEQAGDFYQRPTPQQAQATGFSAQAPAYGYVPDDVRVAE